jgi:hypothetical protein
MTFEERIRAALNREFEGGHWESLIRLFGTDRNAFYELAVGRPSVDASDLRPLADFAAKVWRAVRETYTIEAGNDDPHLITGSGIEIAIPAAVLSEVREFLRAIDGKRTETHCGKDYEGEDISEAEVLFKLGDRSSWNADRARIENLYDEKPLAFKLAPDDIRSLGKQPSYVTHELRNCAAHTVLAPTSAYCGLKRGQGGLQDVNRGYAFFGKPRFAYDNEGRAISPPDGMLFAVFADCNHFVFDWDWTKEDQEHKGLPLDLELRFENPWQTTKSAVLELPPDLAPGNFDATTAEYSSKGDCIFCYMKDDVAWADRINGDLTVFRKLGEETITGFKVKNVRKILEAETSIVLNDAPGLTVAVDAILLATLKVNPEARILIYKVILRALYASGPEAPRVTVPNREAVSA